MGLWIFCQRTIVVVCHRVTAIGIGMMPMLNTYYASLAGAPGMNRIGSQ